MRATRVTPRERIEAECARRGRDAVVAGCVALFAGDDSDDRLLDVLGPPTPGMREGTSRADDEAWFRAWAVRGLLWCFDGSPAAVAAVRDACADPSWRVRENAAKVIARYAVADAFDAVAALREDDVPRVRTVAARAVTALVAAGA